jgi:hypothetical protein
MRPLGVEVLPGRKRSGTNPFTGCLPPVQHKDKTLIKGRCCRCARLQHRLLPITKNTPVASFLPGFGVVFTATTKFCKGFYQPLHLKRHFKPRFKHTIGSLLLYQPKFLVRLSVYEYDFARLIAGGIGAIMEIYQRSFLMRLSASS